MASWQKQWEEDKATKKQRRSARRRREQSREFSIGAWTQESKHAQMVQTRSIELLQGNMGIKHAEMNNLEMKKEVSS